jgi:murein DD-endopeptidase MepM/ murein hydrolase activator NlpD
MSFFFLLLACDAPIALRDSGERSGGGLRLRLPLAEPDHFSLVMGVDHDPVIHGEGAEAWQCVNYEGAGFPRCYDEHLGSDYILEGGFAAMDAGSVAVVAAAAGTVTFTDDGHYDRCHADLASGIVDCDGHEMDANEVTVAHEGGYQTRYLHLMTDSVAVAVGDVVAAGDVLGRVGSSGNSSMPHLHLQLEDADGAVIDPYAGPMSQPESFWCEQGTSDALPGLCIDEAGR